MDTDLTVDGVVVCSEMRRGIPPKKGHEQPMPSLAY